MTNNTTLRYLDEVENAFQDYLELKPLDLLESSIEELQYWQRNIRYDISEFSRQLQLLQSSKNLDEFIFKTHADFDNLAAVVDVAVSHGFIELNDSGISAKYSKAGTERDNSGAKNSFSPNSSYNQFPCDEKSVDSRVEFLSSRYPFTKIISFGLIGDDDFVSIQLSKFSQFKISLVEKDKRIIDTVLKHSSRDNPITIEELDIANIFSCVPEQRLQSFMTDPPYTVHGSLAFIYCGLKRMDPRKDNISEFYVVLNPTMMGRSLFTVIKALSSANIHLTDVLVDFSQYELPLKYAERNRANDFLLKFTSTPEDSLKYSSSSNLYVFSCGADVDLGMLKKYIKPGKMYEHYS